jgi:hypothetical protein
MKGKSLSFPQQKTRTTLKTFLYRVSKIVRVFSQTICASSPLSSLSSSALLSSPLSLLSFLLP